jgi:hypothetical protein
MAALALAVASATVCCSALTAATISNTATLTYASDAGAQVVQSNPATTDVVQGYSIRGRVIDQGGSPVQNAKVSAKQSATRAEYFTTTDAQGDYEIAGLPAATYDVAITAPGLEPVLISGVSVGATASQVTVSSRVPQQTVWGNGLYMAAMPFTFADADAAAVFGHSSGLKLARWIPSQGGGAYAYYGQSGFPSVTPGAGFWVAISDGATLALQQAGAPVSEQAPYAVHLAAGWNMVGNPFCADVDWTAMQVSRSGMTLSLEAAAKMGWIRPYAWAFDPVAKQYVLLDATYSGASKILPVWQACWVRALVPCDLLIAPPGGRAVAADTIAASPKPDWAVQLVARVGDLCDAFNYLGVTGGAGAADPRLSLQSPPPVSPYVDLSFGDGRAAYADLATSLKPPVTGRATWDFVVRTDVANSQVVLSWPDLSHVPSRYRLTLVDQDANRRQYMRTTSSYVFNTGATAGERRFQIEVDSTPWAQLQVNNLQQIASRASGVTISYDVSSAASVDVEVYTLAGALVKTLTRGANAVAGTNLISWDGTDSAGRMMPSGPYLCAIAAITEEGQAVKGMRTIILRR